MCGLDVCVCDTATVIRNRTGAFCMGCGNPFNTSTPQIYIGRLCEAKSTTHIERTSSANRGTAFFVLLHFATVYRYPNIVVEICVSVENVPKHSVCLCYPSSGNVGTLYYLFVVFFSVSQNNFLV